MDGKRWSSEDVQYLVNNFKNFTARELSEQMGRGIEGIKSKISRLGLSRDDDKKPDNRENLIKKPLIGKSQITPTYKRRPKLYPDKNQKLQEKVAVFIDKKTTIYINKGMDPEKAKANYMRLREEYLNSK
jgi:hypothetical protein